MAWQTYNRSTAGDGRFVQIQRKRQALFGLPKISSGGPGSRIVPMAYHRYPFV